MLLNIPFLKIINGNSGMLAICIKLKKFCGLRLKVCATGPLILKPHRKKIKIAGIINIKQKEINLILLKNNNIK